MRKFYLKAYDNDNNQLDMYELENTTDPSGFGLKMKLTKVDGDVKDYIINQAVDKQILKLKVHFFAPYQYEQFRMLRSWIGAYANYKTTLVFDDGEGRNYDNKSVMEMEVKVKELSLGTIEAGILTAELQVQALTPQYTNERKEQSIETTTVVKMYNYAYPYSYGGGGVSEAARTIENGFYRDIPLEVKLYGPITNPQVALSDTNGNVYSVVRATGYTLPEGSILDINAIDMTVRLTDVDGTVTDFYNYLDHSQDTFLFAQSGVSKIDVNLDQSKVNAKAIIIYTQYIL